ncbi:MAG TPA: sulfotransferase [Rhizomicrobium sp.]|nr:sulfotransferase [Rhizomicrobium sp.]
MTNSENGREAEGQSVPGSSHAPPVNSPDDLKNLLRSNPSLGEARAREILEEDPGNSPALLLLGATLQRQGKAEAARAILEALAASQPQMASVQFELGLALDDLGDGRAAFAALSRSVELNPMFLDAWFALGDRFASVLGNHGGGLADDSNDEPPGDDAQLRDARAALHDGRLDTAERLLRELQELRPGDASLIKLLADTVLRIGRRYEAETLLERCLELAPDSLAARFRYATVLFAQKLFRRSLPQIELLLRHDAANSLTRYLKAVALDRAQEFAQALVAYEAFLKDHPASAGVWMSYAHVLRALGRHEHCVAALRRATEIIPGFGEAYRNLASVKPFRFEPAELQSLRAQLARPDLFRKDREQLHFALAKALADNGDYGEAFDNYLKCNTLRQGDVSYNADNAAESVRRAKALFTPAFFRRRAGAGSAAQAPVFIVGMPRSGSTLVEQILASHSAVEAGGEFPYIRAIAHRVDRANKQGGATGHYPEELRNLDGNWLNSLGEDYLRLARANLRLGRPFFTDKMPMNFLHTGLIRLILPNAKLVDVRRHPLDCCLSCFTNYFPASQLYGPDLTDLGRVYASYVELMAHFDEVMPGKVHRVFYEALIENPEQEVRRLLDHLGLPFEEACLRFYDTERGVLTMSAEQVRLPIYRHGIGQWRKFEPWLGPLKEALGPVLEAYPSVPKSNWQIRTAMTVRLA